MSDKYHQTFQVKSTSLDETIRIGRSIGELLRIGMTVGLSGEMGSGKTYLAKGLSLGLGVKSNHTVTSPTYVLLNIYHGRYPVYHYDCYRMHFVSEFVDTGYEDHLMNGVVLIEWYDMLPDSMLAQALKIDILSHHDTQRVMTLSTENQEYASLMDKLQSSLCVT